MSRLPKTMSGSEYSTRARKLSLFVRRLWKLITSIRIFLLEMGVCLRRLGDEANLDEPILLLESTDVFMEECAGVLQLVPDGSKSLNKLVLKFGSPHPQQYQLTSVSSNGSYNTVGIFKHFSFVKPLFTRRTCDGVE